MPYTIKVNENPGLVLVSHYGEVTIDEVGEIRGKVFELIADHNLQSVLVDARGITSEFSVTESFNLTLENVKFEAPVPKPRASIIVRPEQYEIAKFIETVSVNRGLPIRVFTDLEEGLQWLSVPVTADIKKLFTCNNSD